MTSSAEEPLATAIRKFVNNGRLLAATYIADYVICTIAFQLIEHRGPIRSAWWAIVTGFTVGYGDVYPDTTAGRGVGAFLIITTALLWAMILARLLGLTTENPDLLSHLEQENIKDIQAAQAKGHVFPEHINDHAEMGTYARQHFLGGKPEPETHRAKKVSRRPRGRRSIRYASGQRDKV